MAELILPLTRTLFLPAGSPALGTVEAMRGDLRELRCGSSGGETYCLGEADILLEYTLSRATGGLFGREREPELPGPWQALLSFPFQLSVPGYLPPDTACQVELGPLNWTMVASRALELDSFVRLSWDEEPETAAETAVDIETATAMETEAAAEAFAEAAATAVGESGYILRPPATAALAEQAKIKKGGEWSMVELTLDKAEEQERQTVREVVDRQATPIMPITAAAAAATEQRRVEIVDLSGAAPPELEAALARVLAQSEPPPDDDNSDAMLTPAIDEAIKESIEESIEEAIAEAVAAAEAAAAAAVSQQLPEVAAYLEASAPTSAEATAEAVPEITLESVAESIVESITESVTESVTEALQQSVDEIVTEVAESSVDEIVTEAAPATIDEIVTEAAPATIDEIVTEVAPASVDEIVTETLPASVPQLITEILPAATAPDGAGEPQVLEPQPLPPRAKRRFKGLPGLHVEAHNNDIDFTAFRISIKL